jgi:hypothetical protein
MSDEAPRLGLFSARYTKWLFGAAFLVIVLVQGYALWDQADPFNDRLFDAETWRMYAGSDVPDDPRGKMAEAVMREVLPGLTRAEVITVLGPPDATLAAATEPSPASEPLRYYLGMWSGNRTHPDWLLVYFDDDGRFTHAEIVSD